MNRADIRTAARAITELEVSDVSDATLNQYVKDGFSRLIQLERRWPFYEASATLTTVADQRDYPLSAIGAGNLYEVISIVNDRVNGRLSQIDYDLGEDIYLTGNDYASEPRFYSTWDGDLQIWPKPDAVYSLKVRGYRKPTVWYEDDVSEVDADDRLHQPLIWYVVAQMYQLQEDAEMASLYRASFDEAVRLARADIMRASSHAPLVLSGGASRRYGGPLRDAAGWAQ